jgi:magnesium-protoporphyrin O-methyltransferase
MSCAQCQGIAQEFDDRRARRELRRYRKRGPAGTTRMLLEAITAQGMEDASFLDVGGGIGVIQHELMSAGTSGGTYVDGSPANLAVAREEGRRRGHGDHIQYRHGDFVEMAAQVASAHFVVLDRVICCYPDMPALVDASASKAHRLVGLVFPRAHLFNRMSFGLINLVQTLRRRSFRVFLHDTAEVESRLRSHGFRKRLSRRSLLWHVHLYLKDGAPSTV